MLQTLGLPLETRSKPTQSLKPCSLWSLRTKGNMDRLRDVRDAVKQSITCTCSKVMWRSIQLGISLWQIADMISDGFQTAKFYHLSSVSRIIKL